MDEVFRWRDAYQNAWDAILESAGVPDPTAGAPANGLQGNVKPATVANLTHEQLLALRPLLTDGAALFCYATATVICHTGPLNQRLADLRSVMAVLPTYAAAIEARDAQTSATKP
ncbi:MAG: hypothetical protein KGI52_15640 [Burkholderiales bacterium]|nr:hypothetical protein [Burkholderiales bacterium]